MSVVITFITLIIISNCRCFTPVEDKHIVKVGAIESFDTEPSQDIIGKTNSNNLGKL